MAWNHELQPLGDSALRSDAPTPEAANAWRRACLARPLPGVLDVYVAFRTVAVLFDPAEVRRSARWRVAAVEAVGAWFRSQVTGDLSQATAPQRTLELPVCFDADLAPDAARVGRSIDEVVARLASVELSVGAIGFTPGFAYLTGLPKDLQVPRLDHPRPRVEAGSFALGGPYAGVYPSTSPGGWNVVGRSPLVIFDPHRRNPALWAVGDRVRIRPIDRSEFNRVAAAAEQLRPDDPPMAGGDAVFRVQAPGTQTTLQDRGRTDVASLGVSPGGAADRLSHTLANVLVGNGDDKLAIEASLVGPDLVALRPVTVGIAGAGPSGVACPRRQTLAAGERLDLRRLAGGARCYVAVPGGFRGDVVLNGAGTHLRGGFGGLRGRSLREGDILRADADAKLGLPDVAASPYVTPRSRGGITTLSVLFGGAHDPFRSTARETLLESTYTVGPSSDRMGVRCQGPPIDAPPAPNRESAPVVTGAIQVPPGGEPIILGADRATIGGYPVIGFVPSVDWSLIGQLTPGTPLRFQQVSMAEAEERSIAMARAIATARQGVRLADDAARSPSPSKKSRR
jgi:KipI family sensor histidine kinase inhibitor